jgi:endonuclease/exonuclease/phosphatase family metal-dependent hydrolase
MLIATWNLNHRTGKRRCRLEAVKAIATLKADVMVFTEYYPQDRHSAFCAALSDFGWPHWLVSETDGEIANRVLIASRLPLESLAVALPTFDRQFPPNILSVTIPAARLRLIGLRIPAYIGKNRTSLLTGAWDWLEVTMAGLHDAPTVVLGDLNASPTSPPASGGAHFRRVLAAGWRTTMPVGGSSYLGTKGRCSAVDHILCNSGCEFADVRYVNEAGGGRLAGGKGALSDHAALLADISATSDAARPSSTRSGS